MDKKVLWITRTAILTALLVVLQLAASLFGNPYVVGSIVNMMLIVSVMTGGLATGLTVAAVSPFMAKLLGVGPFWSLIPFIMAGNMMLSLVWHFVGDIKKGPKVVSQITALVVAAAAKFLALYFGIVRLAVPLLLKLPEPQASVISALFSVQQLITASIGGILAIVILGTLGKTKLGRY